MSATDAQSNAVAGIHNFEPASEDEVKKTVMKSATKSCELDVIPTWLLKGALPGLQKRVGSMKYYNLSVGCTFTRLKTIFHICNPIFDRV